jgi:hypothetical protein
LSRRPRRRASSRRLRRGRFTAGEGVSRRAPSGRASRGMAGRHRPRACFHCGRGVPSCAARSRLTGHGQTASTARLPRRPVRSEASFSGPPGADPDIAYLVISLPKLGPEWFITFYGRTLIFRVITQSRVLTTYGYRFTNVSARLLIVTFPLLFLMLALPEDWGITISSGRTCHRYRIWGIGWTRRQPGPGLATWEP